EIPRKAVRSRWRCSPRRGQHCRCAHSCSRWRRPDDHHHAHVKHRQGRPAAPRKIGRQGGAVVTGFWTRSFMRRLGLTGGIASGKTWVANQLRELGFHILEADLVGHRLIEPGLPAYEEVIREFGEEILCEDKLIDRKKLGAIVFDDPPKLAKLNSILHP